MKHNIKKFLLPVMAAAAVGFSACSDWTESESLNINTPSLEEQNPELYKQYLAALGDYKKSEHKVVVYAMPGTSTAPTQRNEHIANAPDSVDFVCLKSAADLHPMLVSEIGEVHKKGTRVIYNIDYAVIEKNWKKILEEEAAQPGTQADSESGITEEQRFLNFCKEQTALQLTYCDLYGFDGIEISYAGLNSAALTEEAKAIYAARQETFLAPVRTWQESHSGKLLFFQGSPQNLLDMSLLAKCAYITVDTFSVASGDGLSFAAVMASVPGVPVDRFLAGVTTPSLADPTLADGYFAGFDTDGKTKLLAIKGAAAWAVVPESKFTKAGIYIANAQNDYFNNTLIYKNIREAVSTMNPASKK